MWIPHYYFLQQKSQIPKPTLHLLWYFVGRLTGYALQQLKVNIYSTVAECPMFSSYSNSFSSENFCAGGSISRNCTQVCVL